MKRQKAAAIVVLAKEKFGMRERRSSFELGATFMPFTRADAHERRRS